MLASESAAGDEVNILVEIVVVVEERILAVIMVVEEAH